MNQGIVSYFLTAMLLLVPYASHAAGEVDDIRILIDVSGSMKQNDPANLRIPALKLINGLIPSGSRAGVWTLRGASKCAAAGTVDEATTRLLVEVLGVASRRMGKEYTSGGVGFGLRAYESVTTEEQRRRIENACAPNTPS